MKATVFLSCTISTFLVSLYFVAGYPNGNAAADPEKVGLSPLGWGIPAPSNGTTVSAGQTLVAGNASASVTSTDDVDVNAYNYYGGDFEAENTMNNTATNFIYTDFMEANVPGATVSSSQDGASIIEQDANVFSQTSAVAVDDVGLVVYTQKPNNTIGFSAGTLGVSSWVTATDGTNLASGSGWKANN